MASKRNALSLAAVFISAVVASTSASGANISLDRSGSQRLITISGEITDGDDKRFIAVASTVKTADVVLDSPGGLAQEGMYIGNEISRRGFNTIVKKDAMCASACGFIWLAGRQKSVEPGGQVGFHAVYNSENFSVSSSGNALVGAYLARLGYKEMVIIYVTEAAPRSMRWLTTYDAKFLGLDVVWTDPGPTIAQDPALTKDEIREALLASESERARLRRFPQWFELMVQMLFEAQKTGDNWGAVYYKALSKDDDFNRYSAELWSEAPRDLILEDARNELDLMRRLQSYDPVLCAGLLGFVEIDPARLEIKNIGINALLDKRSRHLEQALISEVVRSKELTTREKRKLKRRYENIIQDLKLSSGERKRLSKARGEGDSPLICKFGIQFTEAVLKQPDLAIAVYRYPDLLD